MTATGNAAAAVRLHPFLVSYSRQLLRSTYLGVAPEDVAQTVCEHLLRYDTTPSTASAVRSLAATIAHRRVIDMLRVAVRTATDPVADVPDRPGRGQHLDPVMRVLETEQSRLVAHLLAPLPPQVRAVLWLRVGLGHTATEVATMLGLTPVAVRVTQHRALERIRTLHGVTCEKTPGKRSVVAAVCGTPAGEGRHRRRGERPCGWCRAAKSAYDQGLHLQAVL